MVSERLWRINMKYQNITYSHEHPRIDLSTGKNDPDCLLNGYLDCIDELRDSRKRSNALGRLL